MRSFMVIPFIEWHGCCRVGWLRRGHAAVSARYQRAATLEVLAAERAIAMKSERPGKCPSAMLGMDGLEAANDADVRIPCSTTTPVEPRR
jgi:hypothetical protein